MFFEGGGVSVILEKWVKIEIPSLLEDESF